MEKKYICLLLASAIGLSALYGFGLVGGKPIGEDEDDAALVGDRVKLTVGVFDGGLGDEWVNVVKKGFEEKYADVRIGDNVGVYVSSQKSRNFTGTAMQNDFDAIKPDIVFAEGASAQFFAERGDFIDITDVVTTPLNYDFVTKTTNADVESITIEDRLNESQKEYFGNVNDKYYALPTVEKHYCISYDIELFEENNLYFSPSGGFVESATAKRGNGPDGKSGTYDDGLPATYNDFFRLCSKIASLSTARKKVYPLVWGANVPDYVSSLLMALETDYLGAEQAQLNYNYNGTLQDTIEIKNGTPVAGEPINITASNGYNMYKSAGKYYALDFLERITKNTSYYNKRKENEMSFSHREAEGNFVMGKYLDEIPRYAMLIDGCWWQSEAAGDFKAMQAQVGPEASAQNRKFGFMPLPKVNSSHLGDYTLLSFTGDICFINKKISKNKLELAKAFIQYCYQNENLIKYTQTTNVCRPVKYDTETQAYKDMYAGLNTWGKSMVDVNATAHKAYQDNTSTIFKNYSVDLWNPANVYQSLVGGTKYDYPVEAMIKQKITAIDYYKGLSNYWTRDVWNDKYKNV